MNNPDSDPLYQGLPECMGSSALVRNRIPSLYIVRMTTPPQVKVRPSGKKLRMTNVRGSLVYEGLENVIGSLSQ